MAIVIVSGAIYIERPASLASAMIPLGINQEPPQGDGNGDTNNDNIEIVQQTTQEGPQGDGDGETNDTNVDPTPQTTQEGPQGDGDGETNDN